MVISKQNKQLYEKGMEILYIFIFPFSSSPSFYTRAITIQDLRWSQKKKERRKENPTFFQLNNI